MNHKGWQYKGRYGAGQSIGAGSDGEGKGEDSDRCGAGK